MVCPESRAYVVLTTHARAEQISQRVRHVETSEANTHTHTHALALTHTHTDTHTLTHTHTHAL